MSRRQNMLDLQRSAPQVLPSMLLCDFGNLSLEVDALQAADVKCLHLDVMDGNFVPNLTYGMPIVAAFKGLTDLVLDVHLMIEHPADYLEQFRDAGADGLTIHVEAVDEPRPVLQRIRDLDMSAGLALNPATPLDHVLPYLECCDLVLVMSVDPGFGGQQFNRTALDKLATLRAEKPDHVMLEVDGGVNSSTITDCGAAGADLLVVGSAIFGQADYRMAVEQLSSLLA
jgi:ribulose-phosphate 3-epimerase